MLVRVIFTTTLVRDTYLVNNYHTHIPCDSPDINVPKMTKNQ